jgi:hypothetical protein
MALNQTLKKVLKVKVTTNSRASHSSWQGENKRFYLSREISIQGKGDGTTCAVVNQL